MVSFPKFSHLFNAHLHKQSQEYHEQNTEHIAVIKDIGCLATTPHNNVTLADYCQVHRQIHYTELCSEGIMVDPAMVL